MDIEQTLVVDGASEPPAVAVDGTTVTLCSNIAQNNDGELAGTWSYLRLRYEDPDPPSVEHLAEHFDEAWNEHTGRLMAETAPEDPTAATESALCELYENVQAMQAQYDSTLCELYELFTV